MARIENTFTMFTSPEEAQAMFVRDIAPNLYHDGGFSLHQQQPGLLEFSDGKVDPFREGFDVPIAADSFNMPRNDRTQPLYAGLRRLTDHRLKVSFEAVATGTTVTVSGHTADKALAAGISRLGQPGYWPATANDSHD